MLTNATVVIRLHYINVSTKHVVYVNLHSVISQLYLYKKCQLLVKRKYELGSGYSEKDEAKEGRRRPRLGISPFIFKLKKTVKQY